ncbi:DSBA-like thioredoxin domain-containing protein [Rhizoctonia solani]|nr:DSBA-like thioredoxin domain-containing protein [Rhizoctonia solani]
MSEPVQVKFYFDIASPYSYIGLERLLCHEKAWNLSVELCPAHLGTILKSSGNFPPFSSSLVKQKYMIMDIIRSARELQIPFDLQLNGPPVSSFDNMAVLRALKTILPQEEFLQVIRKLYAARFGNTTLPDNVFTYLIPTHISQDMLDKARATAQTEEFRLAFEKEHTDLINNHGAFGVPWIIIQKPGESHLEYFWGSERMTSIAHWLGPSYEYSSKLEVKV